MAGTLNKFNNFIQDLGSKVHNLGSDSLKLAFTNTQPSASNAILADITQISTSGGYTGGAGGGIALSGISWSGAELTIGDVVFTATGTVGPFRYLVLYNDTPTSPADPLIGWYDYGASITMSNGEQFTTDFDGTNGVLAIDPSGAVTTYTVTTTFSQDLTQFGNPERGFYIDRTHTSTWSTANFATFFAHDSVTPDNYERDIRLVHYYLILNNYKTINMDSAFLSAIQARFDIARSAGMKIILRVSYDQTSTADATLAQASAHYDQLQPIFAANEDILVAVQCGTVGQWGEFSGSQNFGTDAWPPNLSAQNRANRKAVIDKVLATIPSSRLASVRSPWVKGQFYSTTPVQDNEAHNGTSRSRIGHFDDSFVRDASDGGTYIGTATATFDEHAFMAQDTKWTIHGGETNAGSTEGGYNTTYSTGPAAVTFMTAKHTTYLNSSYDHVVLNHWANRASDSAAYNSKTTNPDVYKIDEIKRRMGYRLELISCSLPNTAARSSSMSVQFVIRNTGFAAPVLARTVYVVFRNTSTGVGTRVALATDLRNWQPGSDVTVSETITVPAGLTAGTHSMHLFLPDAFASLQSRPEYSIRLASIGVWDSVTGYNSVNQTMVIT